MSCHFSKARILFKNNVLSWTKYYSTATNIKTVSKIYETAEAKEPVEIKVGFQNNFHEPFQVCIL